MPGAALWRCGQALHDTLIAWEGESQAVFFCPQSGDTHLISELSLLLAQWLQTPMDRETLLQRLRQDVGWEDPPDDYQLQQTLDSHLQGLAEIGLLEGPAA